VEGASLRKLGSLSKNRLDWVRVAKPNSYRTGTVLLNSQGRIVPRWRGSGALGDVRGEPGAATGRARAPESALWLSRTQRESAVRVKVGALNSVADYSRSESERQTRSHANACRRRWRTTLAYYRSVLEIQSLVLLHQLDLGDTLAVGFGQELHVGFERSRDDRG